ncbi:mannose/glucose-specific lectin Cramoll-like [Salvia hispanica]|uniref:mannose/glucose-specific lectin Cramoll-like n=1 Tax=Salvia hispanica TaxID=49212 RepID=UPI0020098FFC|nr:mannose/glucose-specific lectin Cramoll-like [Salvia hispanica]
MANLNHLQTLIPLLFLLLASAGLARSQTTSFTYDFYGEQPTDLIYQGDAHFPSDSTYLRMTDTDSSGTPLQYRVGRAVYSRPIQFWQAGAQVDLETTIKFIITPKSGDTNPADGFAFFIAPVGSPVGSTGGNFGVFGSGQPPAFAVEFDIFSNPGNDPSYRHVGIDIGSTASKNTTDVGNAILGQEVTARINYGQASKVISVGVAAGSENFEVSYVYDLSNLLPQEVEVGISAATGGQIAVHDLVSWYFTSTLVHTGGGEDSYIRQYV